MTSKNTASLVSTLGLLLAAAPITAQVPERHLVVSNLSFGRFDLRDGSHRHWLAHDGAILDIDVAADGRIATCGNDSTAAVWSPDGTRLAHLRGHGNAVWSIRFIAGGRRVLTASDDGTARIWLLDGVDVLALAEHRLHPGDRRPELAARTALVGDLLGGR